ncbi:MAG: heat-inducible transcriptional repressor HrcA [Chromatiales bacterium]|jgi:heat-inducible transcriptional repressor
MSNTSFDNIVNERSQYFLKVLIERYIREGQPIGSRTLSRDSGLNLSPATIRNVMADLEDAGLIISPHTSAGRVPTISGYRFFVDYLVSLSPPGKSELEQMREQLMGDVDSKALVEKASSALSELTHMAGLVMIPRHEHVLLKQIEFVPLSETRILVILVTSDGEVQNRVIETGKQFSQSDLVQAQNFLNANYGGQKLETMRTRIIDDMEKTRKQMDAVMAQALTLAGQVLGVDREEGDFVLSGQTNLMGFNELSDLERLRHLFDSFAEKRQILHLLDRCMEAEGVQIFIGEESGYEPFDTCSLITAPYENDEGEVAGVLGVVGPTRMDYNKVIPIVDVTARLLSNALKQR